MRIPYSHRRDLSAKKNGRIVRNFFHLRLDKTSVAVAKFVEIAEAAS